MKNIFDIRSYLVFLGRNKAYTLITVLGFALSLAFILLIGLFVWQETSRNSDNPDADRIYAVALEINKEFGEVQDPSYQFVGTNHALQNLIRGVYQQVEDVTSVCEWEYQIRKPDGVYTEKTFFAADSSFFKMFKYDFVAGSPEDFAAHRNAIVITEADAMVFFPGEDPMGKVMTFKDEEEVPMLVTGVIKDISHTGFKSGMMFARPEAIIDESELYDNSFNSMGSFDTFVKVAPEADVATLQEQMDANFRNVIWILGGNGQRDKNDGHVKLMTLDDVYNTSDEVLYRSAYMIGDKRLMNIFTLAALAILIFSIINYINLTVAKATDRAKEMATRRLMGSSRSEIALRMMGESLILCVISAALALALAYAAAPSFEKLLGTELDMGKIFSLGGIAIILCTILIVSVLSGIFPAVVLSRVKPVDVVRGTYRHTGKMVTNKVFIVLQNCVTVIMLGVSLTMMLQTDHIVNAPLGYDKAAIMAIENPAGFSMAEDDKQKFLAFSEELRKLPFVEQLSVCTGTPFSGGWNQMAKYRGNQVALQRFYGDSSFLDILGIDVLTDYNVYDENGVYVTEATMDKTFTPRDSRTILNNGDETSWGEITRVPVRGIIEDFVLRDILNDQSSLGILVYIMDKQNIIMPYYTLVKVRGNLVDAYKSVQKVYGDMFGIELTDDAPYLDQQFQAQFESQIRASKMMAMFTAVALLLSFLGLVAMSTYFIAQRRKDIAIRKVFGGQSKQVLQRLIGSFMGYVVAAFIIAIPVIWYLMSRWLSEYSYRIKLSPWIFLAAGAFALLVSFIAVFAQSKQAAEKNPIEGIVENN